MSTDNEQAVLAAVVLAAGRGRRMGTTKALLPWGDCILLEAWVRRLVDGGATCVAAVVGPELPLIHAQVDPSLPIRWVENPAPDASGPRESLLLGLDALPTNCAALFTPVDVPVVAASTVGALVDAWRVAADAPFAVLPRLGDRTGHPVLAGPAMVQRLYEGEAGDRIDAVLTWAGRRVQVVDVDDERALANMNLPAEYAGWAPTGG